MTSTAPSKVPRTALREASRDYQAFWTTDPGIELLERALDQLDVWSRDRFDVELDHNRDIERFNSRMNVRVQLLHRAHGDSTGFRASVLNTNNGVTFSVTLIVVENSRGGWISIHASSSDRSRRTAKPQIANMILDVVDVNDVEPLRAAPQHYSYSQLEELENLINSEHRRLPVIVAAPLGELPFEKWHKAVRGWTQKCAGLAHVISLDPHSAEEFRIRHGALAVPEATLRTYPPQLSLENPSLDQAARWLTASSLSQDDAQVQRTIETFIRQYQATHPPEIPAEVREWTRAFEKIAARRLRTAVSPPTQPLEVRVAARRVFMASTQPNLHDIPPAIPAVPMTDEVETQPDSQLRPELIALRISKLQQSLNAITIERNNAVAMLDRVQSFLAIPDLSDNTLLELLDAATRAYPPADAVESLLAEKEALESRVSILEDDLEYEKINYDDLQRRSSKLQQSYERKHRESDYYKSQLANYAPADAHSWIDDGGPLNPLGTCPNDWSKMIISPELKKHSIIYTGNPRTIKEVIARDIDLSALQAAWDALGTLAAYRRARSESLWDGDVHSYCESGPAGMFRVEPNKHGQGETSATKGDSRLAKLRLLPVPQSVSESGTEYMWEHFKPYSWSAQKKLRIHYLDQVATNGHVYVGYIGMHLASASTDKVKR